jgi:hypothetical protein
VSEGGFGVDLWWHRASDDATVHVWQSRSGDLGTKDPSEPEAGDYAVNIAGKPWVRNTGGACADTVCLGRRYPNGDVVQLNGTISLDALRRAAQEL